MINKPYSFQSPRVKAWLLFVLLLATAFSVSSQHKYALNLGYSHLQSSNIYIGGEYRLNDNSDVKLSQGPFTIGTGFFVRNDKSKTILLPEIHATKIWKHFLATELSITTENIRPNIGLSFFNLMRVHVGYSFPFENKRARGLAFGINILIGRAPFYDEIKVY